MIERYKLSNNSNIEVVTLYKNEVKKKDFFDENPEIWANYPSQEEFNKVYQSALKSGKKTTITISENGIIVTSD